ncbi:hypothetical protein MMC25_006256 [Agyrium rufum]|nr:hypothetical protein [Agyrium rufum]
MAEQNLQDVVTKVQSVSDPSPADVSASPETAFPALVASQDTPQATKNLDPSADLQPTSTNKIKDVESQEHQTENAVDSGVEKTDQRASTESVLTELTKPILNGLVNSHNNSDIEGIDDLSIKGGVFEGSVSGESTEEAAKKLGDSLDQNRSQSALKKPATFKAVSVTKSFLANAGGAPQPAKAGTDRASPAGGAAPGGLSAGIMRPRLVAKALSGNKALAPKTFALAKGGRELGPDPNQVWNKNRVTATPQATPKHLTDEELRQQYGIHLASRMQEDVEGTEAKWADIDDDEDDWAPDTIEWTDGTKTDLALRAAQAAKEAEEVAAVAKAKEAERQKEIEAAKAKAALLAKSVTSVGPNATILKPGAKLVAASPKTISEKPSLVAKPPSSTQPKSPWASLPPVDKAASIEVQSVLPPQQARFSQRDPHGFDAMPTAPIPTKEIAADDFSRSSRETNGAPQQLFNSQSGRYEPAPENRRGSSRKDGGFRPPAVLQRPSLNDQGGPAEPSPAFQTSRNAVQQDGSWNRRRASSSISRESGERRMSIGLPGDMLKGLEDASSRRRPSQATGAPYVGNRQNSQASFDSRNADTYGRLSQQNSAAASPQLARAIPAMPSAPVPTDNTAIHQAQLLAQKQLMREKREAAIKRRQEEEAKAEAEKRARIALKMQELGLTGEKAAAKTPAADSKPDTPVLKDAQPATTTHTKEVPDVQADLQPITAVKTSDPLPLTVKPEVATLTNGIAAKDIEIKNAPPPTQVNQIPPKAPDVSDNPERVPQPRALVNGVSKSDLPAANLRHDADLSQEHPFKDQHHQQLSHHLPEPIPSSAWGSSNISGGMTTHSSTTANLWGPPSNQQRALGNGNFTSNLDRFHSSPRDQFQSPAQQPKPIGTPKQPSPTSMGQQAPTIPDNALRQAHDSYNQPLVHPSSAATPDSRQVNGTHRADTRGLPNFIKRSLPVIGSGSHVITPSAWTDFAANTERLEAEQSQALQKEIDARNADDRRRDIVRELNMDNMTSTWRQVKPGMEPGDRKLLKTTESQPDAIADSTMRNLATTATAALPPALASVSPIVHPQTRSRFFPQGQATAPYGARNISTANFSSPERSPSPPPPESDDHPAFQLYSGRPLVKLPQPKPTIKLPPANIPAKPTTTTATSTPAVSPPLLRAGSQPLASRQDWQARFNALVGKATIEKPVERTTVQVIDPSSKVSFEITSVDLPVVTPTIITLPPPSEASPSPSSEGDQSVGEESSHLSQIDDEEALFEEGRTFGSVPTVHLPTMDHPSVQGWSSVKPSKSYLSRVRKPVNDERYRVESESISPLVLDQAFYGLNPTSYNVYLHGMHRARYALIRKPSYAPSPPHNKNAKGFNNHRPQQHSRGSVGSNPSMSNQPGKSVPPQSMTGAGPRSQPTHHMSWARKASGVAH